MFIFILKETTWKELGFVKHTLKVQSVILCGHWASIYIETFYYNT